MEHMTSCPPALTMAPGIALPLVVDKGQPLATESMQRPGVSTDWLCTWPWKQRVPGRRGGPGMESSGSISDL